MQDLLLVGEHRNGFGATYSGCLGKWRRLGMTGPLALRIFRAQELLDLKKQETDSLFFLKREAGSGNDAS